jgi:hypothetical protein
VDHLSLCWEHGKKIRQAQKSHTRGGGANASLRVEKFVELDIEHGLPNTTGVYIPGEADHLQGSRESVDYIVHLGPQAIVIEYGELVEPGVVDEAGIAKPVNGELGVVWIWNDGCDDADLGVELQVRMGVNTTKGFKTTGRAGVLTHISAGFRASGVMEKSLLCGRFQLGEVLLDCLVWLCKSHVVRVFAAW